MSRLVVVYALGRYAQLSQTFVDGEVEQLRRDGHDVRVVATRRGELDRSADDRVTYLESIRDEWPRLAMHHLLALLRHPLGYLRFLGRVRALRTEMGRSHPELVRWWRLPVVAAELRRAGVQVVHSHFAWAGAALGAPLAALLGVPWSLTTHANDIFSRTRNLGVKLATADLVVTVCQYNLAELRRSGCMRREPAVITCGVTLPPPPVEPRPVDVDVVCVARLVPKKAVDVLVAAAGLLAAEGRLVSVEVVGDGPDREALEKQAAALGIASSVRFLGSVPHEVALERIGRARVFCLPCRVAPDGDRDAMPTVIVEAMARAVPVVSTTTAGIPEMVDDTTGRLVAADDVAALARALAELLDDELLRERLGAGGVQRVRNGYSVEGQTRRLADELRRLASR